MRLHSTPESVQRGEVSLLAILETLAAITLVFYLSGHLNTLKWLAVAMCVAPLLLLRTSFSVQCGRRVFDRIHARLEDKLSQFSPPQGSVGKVFIGIAIVGTYLAMVAFTRVVATLIALVRHPLRTIQAVPKNWVQITTATDTLIPPEIVPGHPMWRLDNVIQAFIYNRPVHKGFWGIGLLIELLVWSAVFILCVPALLYRWSLKATSIIYFPLVFIVHTTFRNVKNLRTKLELIKRSDLSRISALYALLFIAAFLVKLILMLKLPGFAAWWNTHPVGEFLALYIAPGEIPKWQLASLTNSFLALGLLLFVRHTLLRFELGEPVNEPLIQRLLGLTTGLRLILTLYTILCTAYITLNSARGLPWPRIGENWLPW